MSRVQSIERAFAVLGALADGPLGRDRGGRARPACRSPPPRGCSTTLAREGAVEQVPGRHALPARAAARDARRRAHADPLAGRGRARHRSRRWPRRPARPPACRSRTATSSTTSTRSTRPNPVSVRDWTGTRVPMHAVSSGLVLLAFRPPAASSATSSGRSSGSRRGPSPTRTRCASGSASPPRRLRLGRRRVRRGDLVGGRADRRRVRRGRRGGPRPRTVVPVPGRGHGEAIAETVVGGGPHRAGPAPTSRWGVATRWRSGGGPRHDDGESARGRPGG